MGYRDVVLFIGYQEIGVSLKTNPARVKEYIDASCSVKVYDYLQNSWCTHYLYWVLDKAKKGGIPKTPLGEYSNRRFEEALPKTTKPRPGDIYYLPIVNGKQTDHMGFVTQVFDKEIESLDGNAGDWRDKRTDWGWEKNGQKGGGSGGGMVCLNRRYKDDIRYFLELVPTDF